MSLSSGHRTLLSETLSWVAAVVIGVICFLNFNELKAAISDTLGLPQAGEMTAEAERIAQAEQEAARKSTGGYVVELKAGSGGHYHTEAEVNGRSIDVMVDTGATLVAMTYEDAERAGIFVTDKDFTHRVSTANGTARVAPVMLERVSIGDITVRGVQGVVSERGALGVTLLGMSFLSRLDRVDMRSGSLILED